jgi:hypothetical protein
MCTPQNLWIDQLKKIVVVPADKKLPMKINEERTQIIMKRSADRATDNFLLSKSNVKFC